MDRRHLPQIVPNLVLVSCLVITLAGCRTPRSEVPPGKPYKTTGSPPNVGFSSDPPPATGQGMAGLYQNRGPGDMVPDGSGSVGRSDDMVIGTPTPGSSTIGAPSDHRYSAPGTSGSAGGPRIADSLLNAMPPVSEELKRDPDAAPASGGFPGSR